MKLSGSTPILAAALLAAVTLGWTENQTATRSAALENQLSIGAEQCAPTENCPMNAGGVLTRWISRTHSGNLFLVMQSDCQTADRCNAWFVERTTRGYATRLNVEGQFRVLHSNKPIPDVQTWRALSESEIEYTRYTWTVGAYVKAETRTAYRVDGVECGSALECYQAANKAREQRNTGRALKILEQVHNVSYI